MKIQIETDRLILREFEESDWVTVHSYAGHPDTVKYMDWGPNNEEETKAFIQTSIKSQEQKDRISFDFAIVVKKTGLLIGTAGIRMQDSQTPIADFGYILHQSYWGKGFGTEAARALVEFGFQQLKVHRIWATCRPQNKASSRILEKIGLEYEGHLRQHKKVRGEWVDSLLYAIICRSLELNLQKL